MFDWLPAATSLPHLNATLNGFSAVALTGGYVFIRKRRMRAHRACMIAAFIVSAAFLVSYLIYHFQVGSVAFEGAGWIRRLYFTILISHSILAVVVVPLVLVTLHRARNRQFRRHLAVARWTLPAWIYVSVTGVAVYLMLYQMG